MPDRTDVVAPTHDDDVVRLGSEVIGGPLGRHALIGSHPWWTPMRVLLVMVFVLSSFLDNIAAALIGGAMAHTLFRGRVHIGYLAALVAASNAGGAGSVVGDTTTTMMWINGVNPVDVLHAYIGSGVALIVF